jgi:hypothetical protein
MMKRQARQAMGILRKIDQSIYKEDRGQKSPKLVDMRGSDKARVENSAEDIIKLIMKWFQMASSSNR